MISTLKIKDQVFQINIEEEDNRTVVEIDGEEYQVEYEKIDDHLYSIILDGKSLTVAIHKNGNKLQVFLDGDLYEIDSVSEREQRRSSHIMSGMQEIKSPMPSRVVKILKSEGDEVQADEGVAVVEAMKMESELRSPIDGQVKDIMVNEGDTVEAGTVLLIVSSD